MNKKYKYTLIICCIFFVYIILKKNNIDNFINYNNISVVILNFKRPHNIDILTDKLLELPYIDEIIISHGRKDKENIIKNSKIINETKIRNKYFSATRFYIGSKLPKNNAVLLLDDDLLPSGNLIEKLFTKYSKDNNNIYGCFSRRCDKNGYHRGKSDILTGLCLVDKKVIQNVWNMMLKSEYFPILLRQEGNGEDLLFNYIFKKLYKKNPVYVKGNYKRLDTSGGYSSNKNGTRNKSHYKLRGEFCKKLYS
mgnify:CR=1 FL=1|tara:strand:+ start:7553 stop:8308 length:756 start_codon:yes stop_codon:yes gene_type:complete